MIKPIKVYSNRLPDLHGMGAKDALFLLGQMGLRVQVSGRGKVTAQNISAGSAVKKGQMIQITLD